jgi:hypothetical protein
MENSNQDAKKGLLLDFFVFMAEGGLFFAITSSLRQQNQAFVFFGLLLLTDILWTVVAQLVHRKGKNSVLSAWPGINLIALVVGVLILSFSFVGPEWKGWLLFLLALVRTVVDYKRSWSFYFPFEDDEIPDTVTA